MKNQYKIHHAIPKLARRTRNDSVMLIIVEETSNVHRWLYEQKISKYQIDTYSTVYPGKDIEYVDEQVKYGFSIEFEDKEDFVLFVLGYNKN